MANSVTSSQLVSALNKLLINEIKNYDIVETSKDTIRVGKLEILPINDKWTVHDRADALCEFDNKIVAFEFARNYPRTKYKKAYLTDIDASLSRHKNKAKFHVYGIKQGIKTKDEFAVSFHRSCLSECRFKINQCISSVAKFSKYNF